MEKILHKGVFKKRRLNYGMNIKENIRKMLVLDKEKRKTISTGP